MTACSVADEAIEGAERACAAGDCPTSISLVEDALRVLPHDFRLHYRLGQCYGGGCRPHPMVHPEMAVPYLRQALRLVPQDSAIRDSILAELAHALTHDSGADQVAAFRAALDRHLEAAGIYDSLGRADDWARAHFNIGNLWCDISEAAGEDHWADAIAHYELCLRVRTRQKDPERYAALQENLGTAWRRLPAGDIGANVKNSIRCYRRALAVYSRPAYPDKHAAIENNLGNACLSMPHADAAEAVRYARRALCHFERALRIQLGDPHSRAFGITQYNCAQAYFRLAQYKPAVNLGLAAGCLEAAQTAFESCGEDRYARLIRDQLQRLRPGAPVRS